MADQRHIINELNLELKVPSSSNVYSIQNRLNQAIRQELPGILNEYFEEISEQDILYRIDTLEIDIGKINPENLEKDFVNSIKNKIIEALTPLIRGQESYTTKSTDNQSGLVIKSGKALLRQFLKTGSLPWWADNRDPLVLERNLEAFVRGTSPAQLAAWLKSVHNTPNATTRLIQNFGDQNLYFLIEKISGKPTRNSIEITLKEFSANFEAFISLKGKSLSPSRNRKMAWEYIFYSTGQGKSFSQQAFIEGFLLQLSAISGVTQKAILEDIKRLKESGKLSEAVFPEIQTQEPDNDISVPPYQKEVTETKHLSDVQPLSIINVLANIFDLLTDSTAKILRVSGHEKPDQINQEELTTYVKSYLAQLRLLSQIIQNDRERGNELDQLPSKVQEKIKGLHRLLDNLPAEAAIISSASPEKSNDPLQLWIGNIQNLVKSLNEKLTVPMASVETESKKMKKAKQPTLQKEEEVYVNNAGLVLLAPFYKLFFKHLGLTENGEFVSEESRLKAVHLLHYISFGEEDTLEFLLPLNKLICGLDIADPVEFNSKISPEESEECSNLIKAAVGHAPSLKNISVDGFRGSFILRNGIISVRDRNWLLQVEKQSYDVVLESIPWSYNIVKLPWMDKLIFVEWQNS